MIAQRYIQLAYGIEHYFPGYIDAYSGPPEWKKVEKKSLEELSRLAQALHHDVDSVWLEAQVNSMRTVIDVLRGESIAYKLEIKDVYDIEVEKKPEETFEKAIEKLESLLPGEGDVGTRLETLRDKFTIPPENILTVCQHINQELRQRSKVRFVLPENESFDIQLVNNKTWSGYNWYLGDYKSRVDINTDLPVRLFNLPHLLAHEGYPGHHTEHVLKDKHLIQDQQKLEHSIFLLNSPESVLAEGIAESALEMVMTEAEVLEMLEHLLSVSKVKASPEDLQLIYKAMKLIEELGYVSGNAALMLHEEKRSLNDVQAYLEKYALVTTQRAKQMLDFLQAPASRSYIFTYSVGEDLLKELLKKDRQEKFQALLMGAYTPGMIRAWIKS
jgi:hypothetical protein